MLRYVVCRDTHACDTKWTCVAIHTPLLKSEYERHRWGAHDKCCCFDGLASQLVAAASAVQAATLALVHILGVTFLS